MFIDNNWYGNKYIFSKYCNISEKQIFGSLQHGLFMVHHFRKINHSIKKIGDRTFKIIPWFVWNEHVQNASIQDKSKNVISIGAHFLYLDKILFKKKFIKRNEILIITPKSAQEINHNIDNEPVIKFLKKKKFKKPYKFLVGQSDLEKIKNSKKKFDCTFVSCGDRNNKFFTYRLYRYLKEASLVIALYPGSPILYSVFLKKKTYYFQNRFLKSSKRTIFKNKNLNNKEKINIIDKSYFVKLSWFKKYDKLAIETFKKEYNIDIFKLNSKNSYKKAAAALGINNMKDANQIRKIFGWNNLIKMILAYLLKLLIKIRYIDLK